MTDFFAISHPSFDEFARICGGIIQGTLPAVPVAFLRSGRKVFLEPCQTSTGHACEWPARRWAGRYQKVFSAGRLEGEIKKMKNTSGLNRRRA
jgi:hypothetical protein